MTRPRETSLEAWKFLVESGHLGTRQREVYAALYEIGPAIANDCFRHITEQTGNLFENCHSRFTELREHGLAVEIGKEVDPVTGRKAALWDVTDRVHPLEVVKRTPKAQQVKALVKEVADWLDGDGPISEETRKRAAVRLRERMKEIRES